MLISYGLVAMYQGGNNHRAFDVADVPVIEHKVYALPSGGLLEGEHDTSWR